MDIYLAASREGTYRKLAETAPLPPKKRVEVLEWRGRGGGATSVGQRRLGAWPANTETLRSHPYRKLPRLQRTDFATVGEAVAAIEAHLQLIGGS